MADTASPHLHVEFYMQATEDPNQTRLQNRPIFIDQEFVKIQVAGDPKNTIIAPAHYQSRRNPETGLGMSYAEQFPEHYRFFKDNADQQQGAGTPLTEVPWVTAARRAELKHFKVYTVEGLASLDGSLLDRLGMGGRELKNKAQAWLDAAAGGVGSSVLAAELEARDLLIASLRADLEALKGNPAPAVPAPAPAVQADDDGLGDNSPFWAWEDEDIKNWIKDNAGSRPVGNPSHKTLVSRADEINAELAARRAA